MYSTWATQAHPIIRACRKKPALSSSFNSGSMSVSYGVLDLHGTAVSNNDSKDDHKLLFLGWIDVRFFWEMKRIWVLIDRSFPPTHSMTGTYYHLWIRQLRAKRTRLWLARKRMRNDPCKHFWGHWCFLVNSLGPVNGDFRCPNMMEMSLRFCQKSGIKMAFSSEEWLWNFVESVVSYMNDSCQLISVTRVKLCNSVNQH